MSEENLWIQVANSSLRRAMNVIERETIPTAETVGIVKGLVDIAISIDLLNLRWEEQTRSCAGAWKGPFSEQQEAKS